MRYEVIEDREEITLAMIAHLLFSNATVASVLVSLRRVGCFVLNLCWKRKEFGRPFEHAGNSLLRDGSVDEICEAYVAACHVQSFPDGFCILRIA